MRNLAEPALAFRQPLARGKVVPLILERIKEAIVQKELRPGDYLPSEAELAAGLGVGKTSIREAVKMLQAVGVVDVRQGHGTVIRKEPGADILTPLVFHLLLKEGTSTDLLEFRRAIEPAYMVVALQKVTDADIEAFEAAVHRLEQNIAAGMQTAEDDLAFHRAILEATRNPYMITLGNTILELFRSSIERSMVDIPRTAVEDHRAILEAFRARDVERLKAAVERSFEGWTRSLRAQNAA